MFFLVVRLGMFFCVIFSVYGCKLCLVRYIFVISTSVIDCLGRFVPQMTYYVSSGTLNFAQLNSTVSCIVLSLVVKKPLFALGLLDMIFVIVVYVIVQPLYFRPIGHYVK